MSRILALSVAVACRRDVCFGGPADIRFIRASRPVRRRHLRRRCRARTAGGRGRADAGARPARRRGTRTVQDARHSRRHAHRRHRRAAQGPVDIVVSGNRIASVRSAGTPGLALRANRAAAEADLEIDATGMYLMPGFVDMHVHAGGAPKNAEAEYAYKLWLAHGVTTVRGVPLGSNSVTVGDKAAQREERDRRAAHLQLSAAGQRLGQGRRSNTPEQAREYVRWARGQRHRRPEARRRATGHHGRASRRSEEERPGIDGAPAAGRRRADERDQGRAPRPEYRHALLRPLRVAAEGLRRAALAGGHERRRRAVAVRPGRAAVEQDPRAGLSPSGRRISPSTSSSARSSIRR